jgi:hypothetical protein
VCSNDLVDGKSWLARPRANVGRESEENRRSRGTEQDVAGAYSAAIGTSGGGAINR